MGNRGGKRTQLGIGGVLACFIALLMVTTTASAQQPTATILGAVKDSSGAVVPNATLTAVSQETGQKRVVTTGADGSYRVSGLPVGRYEVRVEQQGFQSEVRGPLQLTVAEEAVINFTLQVGGVEQTVSVTADAPLVNTTSGSLGGLVSEEKVPELPLNGRNYINLTLLQPGVSQSKNMGHSVNTVGTWFSTNGAPVRSNYYMLDGAPLGDHAGATTSSVSGNTLGIESIREWRIITNSFSAEYGMTMGSQMVMVSKSGANQIHGSAFEYFRNSALDARNFFDQKSVATPRRLPEFQRNNYGGSAGGPIRKDKAFFFASYETLRERMGVTTIDTTIPASARVNVVPVVQPLLGLYPLPNLGTSQSTFPFTQPTDDHYGQARADFTFSDRDTLFVRGTIDNGTEIDTLSFQPFILNRNGRVQYYTLSETHIFTPALLSTARFSFSRTNKQTTTPSGLSGPLYSFVPGKEIGTITVGGVTSPLGGDGVSPFHALQNTFTWSDDLFYTKGRHSLKFGALFHHYQQYLFQSLNGRGTITFPSVAAFEAGLPSTYSEITPGSVTDRTYHFNTLGFYVQDDLRVTSRFNLNLGLRYEFLTQPQETQGHGSALRDMFHDTTFTLGPPFKNPSLKNFSPRFGFAWDVNGDGKTSVRGGFGLLFDVATFGTSLLVSVTGTPPFSSLSTVAVPATNTVPVTVPFTIPAGSVGKSARALDYNLQQPHLLQYNLTVERQLPFSAALTVSYVGSRGINILQTKEGNPVVPTISPGGQQFFPVGAPRTNPAWGTIELKTAAGNSWYNALQVGLNKRVSKGLQFQANYTWSRCIDEVQGQFPGENTADNSFGQDPVNRTANRGLCTFDVTQNWQFSSLYNLPQSSKRGVTGALLNGWWAGTIMSAQSGLPFTPALQTNRSRSGVNGGAAGVDHPNLVPGRSRASMVSGVSTGCLVNGVGIQPGTKLGGPDLYFDPCAFTIPAAGFYGNAGRDILRGPGVFDLDLTLAKDTPLKFLGEGGKLQFRAEIFNILNRANFTTPNQSTLNTAAIVYAGNADVQAPLATAGRITSTSTSSRQIQLALKILF